VLFFYLNYATREICVEISSLLLIKLICSKRASYIIRKTFTRFPLRVEFLLLHRRVYLYNVLDVASAQSPTRMYQLWYPLSPTRMYPLWYPLSYLHDVPVMGHVQSPLECTGSDSHPVSSIRYRVGETSTFL
jgi:hypothetical protein